MGTLESTISILEVLPEADLLEVQQFAKNLFMLRRDKHQFSPKSREEIYKDLEVSRQQAAEGKCQDMGKALAEIREKYGL